MKILYLSCHSILEYDELRILDQLGFKVTSIGAYIDPKNPHTDMRPPLNIWNDSGLKDKIHFLHNQNLKKGIAPENCSNTLTEEVVKDYDIIIIMHKPDWIEKNWKILKNKIVILRTIGQNLEHNEIELQKYVKQGLKIIRYSPKERELKSFAGEDIQIRFLKYKSDFKQRNVKNDTVISFGQHIPTRKQFCGSSIIEEISSKFNFKLFGPGNESYTFSGGKLSYEDQIEMLSSNACYLYTGTFPAQYTLNFIEAFMAEIPIVSIGKKLSQVLVEPYPFEVPCILDNCGSMYSDDVDEMVLMFNKLLSNSQLRDEISLKQKQLSYEMFSAEKNMIQWKEFLNSL